MKIMVEREEYYGVWEEITIHTTTQLTTKFIRGWPVKEGEMYFIGGPPHSPLIEALSKIEEIKEIKEISMNPYKITVILNREKTNEIIPKIEKILRDVFREKIKHVEYVKKGKETNWEVIWIPKSIIWPEEDLSFSGVDDEVEKQPEIVRKLFKIPGIVEINVSDKKNATEMTLIKGKLFDWKTILPKVVNLLRSSSKILEEDEKKVLKQKGKLLERIKKVIPKVQLPVLLIYSLGDYEWKDLGFFNGRIEDVLRYVKSSLRYTSANIFFYPTPESLIKVFLKEKIETLKIKFVGAQKPLGKEIKVGVVGEEDYEEFKKRLVKDRIPYREENGRLLIIKV